MPSRRDDESATVPAREGSRGPGTRLRVPGLVLWMIAAIAGVSGLAFWDEQREARAALDDFADDQAWLAEALSRALAERIAFVDREAEEGRPIAVGRVLPAVRSFERPGDVHVMVKPPGSPDVVASDGSIRKTQTISAALAGGMRSVSLSREEASALGLPRRLAMAGLARVDAGRAGTWHVVVVATAQSERDRESRARARLLLGVTLVAALVFVFGGLALRRRTREMELRHALTIRALETKRDEKLVRADKLATLGALAMGIAHEVSTPLGVIVARADQILSRPDAVERVRRSGEAILSESERINGVIRGLLALARGETPTLESADPAILVREALSLVSHRFAKSGVRVTARVDSDAPPVVCDARLVVQVLVNLLLNACEACDEDGSVEVAVREEAGHVSFEITDDGRGIDAATVTRATEPFFTTKPHGTGLGLAIANEIVKHHRGRLDLEPRAARGERGTRAVVRLPRASESNGDD